ncbi:MAG: type II toxin-antitoxin system PemK/MazF family toxin [Aggregatilineales bacterium]
MPPLNPQGIVRGEVWFVRFDPGEGDEIQKTRPAIVMTAVSAGRIGLHIVVPITAWQPQLTIAGSTPLATL